MRELCDIPNDAPVVIMLATYEPRKGHEYSFAPCGRFFSERPDTHLVICGDGTASDISRVEQHLSILPDHANVHLKGFQPKGPELIHDADIVAIASQEFESFGWTAIEGMIRGSLLFRQIVADLSRLSAMSAPGSVVIEMILSNSDHICWI